MEDSTLDNIETNVPAYNILGAELTTLVLQVGFVEGIVSDSLAFHELTEAFQHIFRNNKEYAIVLWNGIPIRLSYVEDIPLMVEGLIEFLEAIQNNTKSTSLKVSTKNNQWQLDATLKKGELTIKSHFSQLSGNYHTALLSLNVIKMEAHQFLNEWKLLLEQLITAKEHSSCKLNSKQSLQYMKRLQILNDGIVGKGILYS